MTKKHLAKPLSVAMAVLAAAGCSVPVPSTPLPTEAPQATPAEPGAPAPATPVAPAPTPTDTTLALVGSVAFHGQPMPGVALALFDARTGARAPEGRLVGEARTNADGRFSLRLAGAADGEVYRLVAIAGRSSALAGTFLVTPAGVRVLEAPAPAAGFRVAEALQALDLDEVSTTLSIAAGGPLRLGVQLKPGAVASSVGTFFAQLATTAPLVSSTFTHQPSSANRVAELLDPATGWLRSANSGDAQLNTLMPRSTLADAARGLLTSYSQAAKDDANRQSDTPPAEEIMVGLGLHASWGDGHAVVVQRGDGSTQSASAPEAFTRPSSGSSSGASSSASAPVVPAPTVSNVSPAQGGAAGGTSVTITGTNLTGATAVTFGSSSATAFTVDSATQITATAPAGTGTVDVTVATPGGSATAAGAYTYLVPTVTGLSPVKGSAAGGTSVTIAGTNLSGATGVSFGGTPASSFTVDSDTQITATAPAGSTGTVDVQVTTADGTTAIAAADQFTYAGGRLYVATAFKGALSFDSASSLSGNVAPTTQIMGTSTGLSSCQQSALDVARDTLYAIGSGTTVAVYTNADTATGDLAPTRTITGFAGLQGIAIDSANDRLYVSNANTIWIIDNASMINGAVGTVRTVTGGSSFAFLSLDVANNRLFTGEGTNYRVNVFDNASTMNGTYAATVSRTIIGPATLLNTPRAVYYHPATDKLYVASYGSNSIQVFANAGSASGNVAPAQNLSGSSTTLLQPYAVLVNGATNELVVANNGSSGLRIYANADTVTGNTAPTRSVSGTSTNITSVRSLLLDPNR